MRKTLFITIFIVGFVVAAKAQAVPNCPDGYVCLTPAAARAALETGDKLKAVEAQSKVQDAAIVDLKQQLADMRVNYAEAKGEGTILKQRAVSDAAMIELLTKLVRPKKFGIINF
jgi:hypothetical protein